MSKIISATIRLYVPQEDIDRIRKLHNEDKRVRHDSEIALRIAEGQLMTKTPFVMFRSYFETEETNGIQGGYLVSMTATPVKGNKDAT